MARGPETPHIPGKATHGRARCGWYWPPHQPLTSSQASHMQAQASPSNSIALQLCHEQGDFMDKTAHCSEARMLIEPSKKVSSISKNLIDTRFLQIFTNSIIDLGTTDPFENK